VKGLHGWQAAAAFSGNAAYSDDDDEGDGATHSTARPVAVLSVSSLLHDVGKGSTKLSRLH